MQHPVKYTGQDTDANLLGALLRITLGVIVILILHAIGQRR